MKKNENLMKKKGMKILDLKKTCIEAKFEAKKNYTICCESYGTTTYNLVYVVACGYRNCNIISVFFLANLSITFMLHYY